MLDTLFAIITRQASLRSHAVNRDDNPDAPRHRTRLFARLPFSMIHGRTIRDQVLEQSLQLRGKQRYCKRCGSSIDGVALSEKAKKQGASGSEQKNMNVSVERRGRQYSEQPEAKKDDRHSPKHRHSFFRARSKRHIQARSSAFAERSHTAHNMGWYVVEFC
jgi:hypothetical protein